MSRKTWNFSLYNAAVHHHKHCKISVSLRDFIKTQFLFSFFPFFFFFFFLFFTQNVWTANRLTLKWGPESLVGFAINT